MLTKGNTNYVKTSLENDIYENVEVHYPGKHDGKGTGHSNFDFAFQLGLSQ